MKTLGIIVMLLASIAGLRAVRLWCKSSKVMPEPVW
jgi:hypothetical protein